MHSRAHIVSLARDWLGTPYHHQASMRGVGTDCIGLVRGIYRDLYGGEAQALPAYTRDWAEGSGRETLLEAARRHLVEIAPFDARPGDVLVFRWRRKGWLARVDRTLAAANTIARALPSPAPSQQPEKTPMADATQPAAPETKWWGQSMTMWGVIITTLSTVLPVVGPLVGLDITAELIRQLGDQLVVVVQAVGGLVGTILTIWGRARATTSLERRQITLNM